MTLYISESTPALTGPVPIDVPQGMFPDAAAALVAVEHVEYYRLSGVLGELRDHSRCPFEPETAWICYVNGRASYVGVKGRRVKPLRGVRRYTQGGYSIKHDQVELHDRNGLAPLWLRRLVETSIAAARAARDLDDQLGRHLYGKDRNDVEQAWLRGWVDRLAAGPPDDFDALLAEVGRRAEESADA
jgi:hypothetical protein